MKDICEHKIGNAFLDGRKTRSSVTSQKHAPICMHDAYYDSQHVDLDMPDVLNATTRQDIMAAPGSVPLHALAPYFYSLGMRMAHL